MNKSETASASLVNYVFDIEKIENNFVSTMITREWQGNGKISLRSTAWHA